MPDGRKLVVVQHAVDRLRQRNCDDRSDEELRDEIVREVRAAIGSSRIANHKIDGFLLYREKRKPFQHDRDRFVWTEDSSVAWIVRRLDGADIVLTTLSRAGVRR